RREIAEKQVSVEHVSSHTGSATPEQKGNDAADKMANKYRLQGESTGPVPYLISTEELLFLNSKDQTFKATPVRSSKKWQSKEWRTLGDPNLNNPNGS